MGDEFGERNGLRVGLRMAKGNRGFIEGDVFQEGDGLGRETDWGERLQREKGLE